MLRLGNNYYMLKLEPAIVDCHLVLFRVQDAPHTVCRKGFRPPPFSLSSRCDLLVPTLIIIPTFYPQVLPTDKDAHHLLLSIEIVLSVTRRKREGLMKILFASR